MRTRALVTSTVLVLLAFCARALALPVVVDPSGAAFVGTWSVEWNADANFESWTRTQVAGAAVSGGVLSGTTSGTDPQVVRSNFAGGPDLDLGFNDYLETRLQVPANFAGDIQIYYGTTGATGFSAARIITIPNATIPHDGAFHTYRIDVGPEPWWRGTLRALRIERSIHKDDYTSYRAVGMKLLEHPHFNSDPSINKRIVVSLEFDDLDGELFVVWN